MGFADYAAAMRMRDTIKSIVREVLNEERPEYRYGTVQSVNLDTRRAMVRYNGDSQAVPVPLGPHRPIVGSVVRIDGLGRDRHISEIITGYNNTYGVSVGSDSQLGIEVDSDQTGYPPGISATFVSGGDGWPGHGVVLTINMASTRFSQLWFAKQGGQIMFRGLVGNGPTLSEWTSLL